ncbi:hypothetical protein, partial [Acetomicrobium sp. S15 = DSM 107314]|uniref:hypothetical protein n=1 Tax=Acetomicrobium sp. S15 = DSM 107314 TaxID=2529858 RepID=UPI0018E15AAA
ESKAEQALAALKKMAAPVASVIRDGHQITVPASELVPGERPYGAVCRADALLRPGLAPATP